MEIVKAIRYADEVVPQVNRDKFAAWEKYHFNKMFVGDDWKGSPLFNEVEKSLEPSELKWYISVYKGNLLYNFKGNIVQDQRKYKQPIRASVICRHPQGSRRIYITMYRSPLFVCVRHLLSGLENKH